MRSRRKEYKRVPEVKLLTFPAHQGSLERFWDMSTICSPARSSADLPLPWSWSCCMTYSHMVSIKSISLDFPVLAFGTSWRWCADDHEELCLHSCLARHNSWFCGHCASAFWFTCRGQAKKFRPPSSSPTNLPTPRHLLCTYTDAQRHCPTRVQRQGPCTEILSCRCLWVTALVLAKRLPV